MIFGTCFDADFVDHGFLRGPDGTFTKFDPPGSAAPFGTLVAAINPKGEIVGNYYDGSTFHGFLRRSDGTFANVDPPGFAFSVAAGINPARVISGDYEDGTGVEHGFLFVPAVPLISNR